MEVAVPDDEARKEACRPPEGRHPIMRQKWRDLLFLHWEWDPEAIQRTLPPGLTVDRHADGRAFLGVVPFFMGGVRPVFCPAVPGLSHFPELNLRTYVLDASGRPGVWFYSLDADQGIAVALARRFFHLPYHRARMSAELAGGWIDYRSRRRRGEDAGSRFVYRSGRSLEACRPGSLEFFLVERYRLFAWDGGRERLFSGRVWHPPYPIAEAALRESADTIIGLAGFGNPGRPPDHALYSPGVDVRVFAVDRWPQGETP